MLLYDKSWLEQMLRDRRPKTAVLRTLLVCLALLVAMEREAQAYTDPGTGALLWQLLVAGLVGCLFYFRKITSWFKGRKRDTKN
jgi:hypothetical protein